MKPKRVRYPVGRRAPARFAVALAALLLLAPVIAQAATPRHGPPKPPPRAHIAAASPADAPLAGPADPPPSHVPRELLVRFKRGASARVQARIHAQVGATFVRHLLLPRTDLVRVKGVKSLENVRLAYRRYPVVQFASLNRLYNQASTFPDDPDFVQQWQLRNVGQAINGTAGTSGTDINAPQAWDFARGENVTVGVVDSGVDTNYSDLEDDVWRNPGESGGGRETNGVDDDHNGLVDDVNGYDFADGDADPADTEGHGTYIAGLIAAAQNNALRGTGVAPAALVAALRACTSSTAATGPDVCPDSAIADAFTYANRMGMQVVSAALSGPNIGPAVQAAIAAAPSTMYVVAAGNGGGDVTGDDVDTDPEYPCSFPEANIVCVAATDQDDKLASFSNFGFTSVDVAAPGVNVLGLFPFPGGQVAYQSGTSPATALTAGTAALLYSRLLDTSTNSPNTVAEVKRLLIDQSHPLGSLVNKVAAEGRIDAFASLPMYDQTPSPGDIDPFFSLHTTSFSSPQSSTATAVALQRDGKVLLAGVKGSNAVVGRINPDGTPDPTFGTAGFVMTPGTAFGGSMPQIFAVVFDPSTNKITVGGNIDNSVALARYNLNGTLDPSFGGDGIVTMDIPGSDFEYITGLVLQSGKLVASGTGSRVTADNAFVARFDDSGALDTTFNTTGIQWVFFPQNGDPGEFNAIAKQTDDKLVLVGDDDADMDVVRVLADGGLDSGFGTDGIAIPNFGLSGLVGKAIAIDDDTGTIYAAGIEEQLDGSHTALAAFDTDGAPVTAFNGTGIVVNAINETGAFGIAVQNDPRLSAKGRIVVAGTAGGNAQLSRYRTDGTLDYFWANGGQGVVNEGVSDWNALAIAPNGKIAVAGDKRVDIETNNFGYGEFWGSTLELNITPNEGLVSNEGGEVFVEGSGFNPEDDYLVQLCGPGSCATLETIHATNDYQGHINATEGFVSGSGVCPDTACALRIHSPTSGETVTRNISYTVPAKLTATPSAGSTALGQSVTVGQPITVDAVVDAGDNIQPEGTIDFLVCGPIASPATCGQGADYSPSKTLTGIDADSAHAVSEPFTAVAPGRYCFRTVYSGDDTHRLASDESRTSCVTVRQPSASLQAVDDFYRFSHDSVYTTSAATGVLQNDLYPAGSTVTAVLDTNPLHGDLTLNPDGSFTYLPDPGFSGTDDFTYLAQDSSNNQSSPEKVTLEVSALDDPLQGTRYRGTRYRGTRYRGTRYRTADQVSMVAYAQCRSRFVWVNPEVTIPDEAYLTMTASLYDSKGVRLATSDGYIIDDLFFGDPFIPTVLTWPVWTTPAPSGGVSVEVVITVNPDGPAPYTITATANCVT